jgi:amidase
MHRIPREQRTFVFAADVVPVARVDPGSEITFETHDTSSGRLTSEDDLAEFLRTRDVKKVNPATGPIFINGAEPGDELIVEIAAIELNPRGWVRAVRGAGVLQHGIEQDGIVFVAVENGMLDLGNGLRLPARPMVGVIGTAPASGVVYTAEPGPQGSNLDINLITTGARVHLPVHVPGALLAIGDVHASMGDGEVTGTGIEIGGEVKVRVELAKGSAPRRVWIETPDAWVSSGQGATLDIAVEEAVEELCALLMARLGASRTQAFLLTSARGDVRIGQCARIPNLDATAYAVFPKIAT